MSVATLPRRSYRDIHAILLKRITDGEWSPGGLIPGEAEIARHLKCSRPTVNRAMRALANAGLIERKRKAGTRVVPQRARKAVLTIPIVRAEIEARGQSYIYKLLSRAMNQPPEPVRAILRLPPQAKAIHVRGVHFADGLPQQIDDRWINPKTIPEALEQDFQTISANEWLVGAVPYTDAEHRLFAAAATRVECEALSLEKDEPVFVIERTTWLRDATVTHARLVHPGRSFSITTRDAATL